MRAQFQNCLILSTACFDLISVLFDSVRKSLPKFSTSLLSSAKILAQRSAVPALQSRTTSSSLKRKTLTHEEKDRLLRMGKRVRKGPFNAVIDPTEVGAGSAMLEMSEAVKSSGQYDMWNRNGSEEIKPEWETISSKPKKVKVRYQFQSVLPIASLDSHVFLT